jgi:hypothetical protein
VANQAQTDEPGVGKPIVRRIILSALFGFAITALPLILSFVQVEVLWPTAFLWGPGVALQSALGAGDFRTQSVALPLLMNIAFYGVLIFLFLSRKKT